MCAQLLASNQQMDSATRQWGMTMRYQSGSSCLALRLSVLVVLGTFFAFSATQAHAQAENLPYSESFDQEQADGWQLTPGYWRISGGALIGRGPGWATYVGGKWDNMAFSFGLQDLTGTLHANVMTDGSKRYLVGLQNIGEAIHVYLERQDGPDNLSDELASSDFPYRPEELKQQGLQVQIIVDGPTVRTRLNGETVIQYDDPNRLPSGTIAFETLDGSAARIGEVNVAPIYQEPGSGECDLSIIDAYPVDFMSGSVIIVFHAEIANEGE